MYVNVDREESITLVLAMVTGSKCFVLLFEKNKETPKGVAGELRD